MTCPVSGTRPVKTKQLAVEVPQGLAGSLHRESQYVFNYIAREREAEVSLTMPLPSNHFSGLACACSSVEDCRSTAKRGLGSSPQAAITKMATSA